MGSAGKVQAEPRLRLVETNEDAPSSCAPGPTLAILAHLGSSDLCLIRLRQRGDAQAAESGERFRVWPAIRYLMAMRTFWVLTLAVGAQSPTADAEIGAQAWVVSACIPLLGVGVRARWVRGVAELGFLGPCSRKARGGDDAQELNRARSGCSVWERRATCCTQRGMG